MRNSTSARFAFSAVAIGVITVLAACAGPQDQQPAEPAPVVATADCLAHGLRYFEEYFIPEVEGHDPAPEEGAVPAQFPVVEAMLCEGTFGTEIDGQAWSAVNEIRYEGDFSPLLAALAEPTDASDGNTVCTADYEMVPELWIVAENGEAIRAAWPRDACGKTKPGVRAALGSLEVVSEELVPVAPIEGNGLTDSCLSQLPPGDLPAESMTSDTSAEPMPIEDVVAEPLPGESATPAFPGGAADVEC